MHNFGAVKRRLLYVPKTMHTNWTRKPSWCWHTRATQKRWKKFLHFEVI